MLQYGEETCHPQRRKRHFGPGGVPGPEGKKWKIYEAEPAVLLCPVLRQGHGPGAKAHREEGHLHARVLGHHPVSRLFRPDAPAPAGHRHHRHQREDHRGQPGGGRPVPLRLRLCVQPVGHQRGHGSGLQPHRQLHLFRQAQKGPGGVRVGRAQLPQNPALFKAGPAFVHQPVPGLLQAQRPHGVHRGHLKPVHPQRDPAGAERRRPGLRRAEAGKPAGVLQHRQAARGAGGVP